MLAISISGADAVFLLASLVKAVAVAVTVFPMTVRRQLEDWPERLERQSRWVTPGEAAKLVEERGLVDILLEARLASSPPEPAGDAPAGPVLS
jgi:hypothetical protein